MDPFNSLYWDFCFASFLRPAKLQAGHVRLSIPFIGIFALHRRLTCRLSTWAFTDFQFPLLGFLLCIERIKFL